MSIPDPAPASSTSPPWLSVCMIARDEEQCIARALTSVLPLEPELVVVDTGSRDATAARARALGARVVSVPWTEDFSGVRNAALERAAGNWVFHLDADETLAPEDLAAFRALTASGRADAWRIVTRNYTGAQSVEGWVPCAPGDVGVSHGAPGWFPSWKIRLHRRLPGIRFVGRVHELVELSVLALRLRVEAAEIPVHHYGYWEADPAKPDKGRLYERLGRAKAEEAATPKALYELGAQALANGHLEEAAACFDRAVRGLPGFVEAAFALARTWELLGRSADAAAGYRRVADASPRHWECRMNLANLLWREGRVGEAERTYAEALQAGPEAWLVHYNFGVFAAGALQRRDRAEAAFRRSLELNGFHAPTYQKLARLALERGNVAETRRWIEAGLARCRDAEELRRFAAAAGLPVSPA